MTTRIDLEGGKYSVIHDSGTNLHVLRYGEPWRDCNGDGFILALAHEVETLREQISAVKPATHSPWQPIETAPQDGTPILGWCSHEADSGERAAGTLSHYATACEGLGHVKDGYNVVSWVEESLEGSWEEGYCTVPGYWALADECGECCANPTHWMPLPAAPVKPAGQKGSET